MGACNAKEKHNKRSSIPGCRLIPISWYIDSDLRGELIWAQAPSCPHFDPTAVGCGPFEKGDRQSVGWIDGWGIHGGRKSYGGLKGGKAGKSGKGRELQVDRETVFQESLLEDRVESVGGRRQCRVIRA